MNILITDDEHLARERLKRLLSGIGDFCVLEASNGLEAIEICKVNDIHFVFMDIRMPVMDGLEAALHISEFEAPPAIVFVTAYDDYALQAFSVHAVDYLLKPASKESLSLSLTKAKQLNKVQATQLFREATTEPARKHISARVRGEIQLIPLDEILYFHADQKYVNVKHINGEVLIEDALKSLEVEFEQLFVRIHRNALVNKAFIASLAKNEDGHLIIKLKQSDDNLEVSRRHASEVRKLVRKL